MLRHNTRTFWDKLLTLRTWLQFCPSPSPSPSPAPAPSPPCHWAASNEFLCKFFATCCPHTVYGLRVPNWGIGYEREWVRYADDAAPGPTSAAPLAAPAASPVVCQQGSQCGWSVALRLDSCPAWVPVYVDKLNK